MNDANEWWSLGLGMLFLMLTGALLVMDLDRPDRFLNVLFRPQWKSWLVRGGYTLTIYGGLLTAMLALKYFEISGIIWDIVQWISVVFALLLAVYTAFLFAQAKGRDFWQSPSLALHMLIHSIMAGSAVFAVLTLFVDSEAEWVGYITTALSISVVINLFIMVFELTTTHPTVEAKITVEMIVKGAYSKLFWTGSVFIGNLIPLALLQMGVNPVIASVLVLIGIYITEKIWVEAPQKIQLV
jgi:formate-dependent nitrite reductase membrane component NrfD